jgi:hypothetical protein
MKNLYRQTESRSIIHHVADLSYYLYHHLNQTRISYYEKKVLKN